MPSNSTNDTGEMLYIKDYASFILKNKLDDFIPLYLMTIYSFKIPLLQFFSSFTEEEKLQRAKDGVLKLLIGIQKENALNDVKEALEAWKNDCIPGIPRDAISLRDIALLYSAQKVSFQSFLPYYTCDVAVATQVVNEIELYYKQVHEMALQTLETIRQEEHQKRIESEEKYRDLLDNASDMIQIVAPDGKIIYVNNAWANTLGYNKEELKGRSIYEFLNENEKSYFKDYRKKVIKGESRVSEIITRLLKKDGEEITVEASISCRYINGQPGYTRGILRNISNRLQQEKQINFYLNQLAEREENLRDIIENGPDGVIVIDTPGNIIFWNSKAEEIFGWKKDEVKDKKMADLIIPVHLRGSHNKAVDHFVATYKPHILNQTIEVPALHKNGNEFFISLTVSHSKQAGKDIFIAFLRDITRQKKNELELENKRKQLEKSNSELEQYAWLTSHDLKEPLRKILTYSDALIKKTSNNFTEETLRFLGKIHSSATRMNALIEAVLIYSNVADQDSLFVVTDLNEILREVIEDLELVITSKAARINKDKLPVIEAIPVQMRQLFQNLISNALKYSKPNETPVINITHVIVEDGYEITIRDNGLGFEKLYTEKIFQVFQRLLSSNIYEGTGIGLALCKKIADTHGGKISADSEPGKGSSFKVFLPSKHNRLNYQ